MPFTVSLDPSLTALLALVGAATGTLALVLALVALLRLRRLRRGFSLLQGGDDQASFVEVVSRKVAEVDRLRRQVEATQHDVGAMRVDLADAIRHVAVVRYDAFGDMGGRMSFSAAMLDDAGDGLVLTSINGRSETRTYAKGVKAGGSEMTLSPEEQQVIGHALRATGSPVSG